MAKREQKEAYAYYINQLTDMLVALAKDDLLSDKDHMCVQRDIDTLQDIIKQIKAWKEDKEGRGIVYLTSDTSQAHSVLDLYDCAMLRMMGVVGDNISLAALWRVPISTNIEYNVLAKAKHFIGATARYHQVDMEQVRIKIPQGHIIENTLRKAMQRAKIFVDRVQAAK